MFFYILDFLFMFAQVKPGGSFPQPLCAEEERECLELLAAGDKSAKNKLVTHNLRLVAFIARRYQNSVGDSEDLISVGSLGLIKAVTTFNPERGIRLATYASKCIENEILMYLRALKKHSGEISFQDPVGTDQEGNEITLEDKLSDDNCDIEEQVSKKIQLAEMRSKLSKFLKGREKYIIEKRYGLSGSEETTQREIASEMRISRSYVSRLEKKALKKLHKEMVQDSGTDAKGKNKTSPAGN